ncbi:MAG: 50S ribosomal protein L32 [Patescibacteria group bacterium]|jgi:large subunit ribosomal protein L32
MAEPKKRTNNSKQGMRRMHDKVAKPALVFCPKCHEPQQKHVVCYNCGHYGETKVLDIDK